LAKQPPQELANNFSYPLIAGCHVRKKVYVVAEVGGFGSEAESRAKSRELLPRAKSCIPHVHPTYFSMGIGYSLSRLKSIEIFG
jgi:hypothetical protein